MPSSPDLETQLIIITELWILNYQKNRASHPLHGFNQEGTSACVQKTTICVVLGEPCPLCMKWDESR